MIILALLLLLQSPSLDTAWVWREVLKPNNGPPIERPHSEVLIKADGRWKETRIIDGGRVIRFGDGNGIFSHSSGDRVIFREGDFQPLPTYRQLVSDEAERRKDSMLGHEAVVYREDKPGGWIEVWIVPALGRQRAAKIVRAGPAGAFILEAVSIERREIPEEEMALPTLPIQRRASQSRKPKDRQQ